MQPKLPGLKMDTAVDADQNVIVDTVIDKCKVLSLTCMLFLIIALFQVLNFGAYICLYCLVEPVQA